MHGRNIFAESMTRKQMSIPPSALPPRHKQTCKATVLSGDPTEDQTELWAQKYQLTSTLVGKTGGGILKLDT